MQNETKTETKQNNKKGKKIKTHKLVAINTKVPVRNIKQNKTKKVFQNSCDKCSNFIGIPSVF